MLLLVVARWLTCIIGKAVGILAHPAGATQEIVLTLEGVFNSGSDPHSPSTPTSASPASRCFLGTKNKKTYR
jgi:hypothetical protein